MTSSETFRNLRFVTLAFFGCLFVVGTASAQIQFVLSPGSTPNQTLVTASGSGIITAPVTVDGDNAIGGSFDFDFLPDSTGVTSAIIDGAIEVVGSESGPLAVTEILILGNIFTPDEDLFTVVLADPIVDGETITVSGSAQIDLDFSVLSPGSGPLSSTDLPITLTIVPEPATSGLLFVGLLALGKTRTRRN